LHDRCFASLDTQATRTALQKDRPAQRRRMGYNGIAWENVGSQRKDQRKYGLGALLHLGSSSAPSTNS
jgi:hypothetical protein